MDCRHYFLPDIYTSAFRTDLIIAAMKTLSSFQSNESFRLDCSGRVLDIAAKPAVMGIINLTPDSFFDGGTFGAESAALDFDKALDCALAMIDAGASIIDVGGESTRPGSKQVSCREEISRTVPFISMLRKKTDAVISIDTYKSDVAEKALMAGAGIVNDISGFMFDSKLPEVCRKHACCVVLMHTAHRPEKLKWSPETGSGSTDIIERVMNSLRYSIEIAKKHNISGIVVDPGFGFGKSIHENFRLLGNLEKFHELGYPLLAGVSRKSFLGEAVRKAGTPAPQPSERLTATVAAETVALLNGANILRVHDVESALQARAVVLTIRDACR